MFESQKRNGMFLYWEWAWVGEVRHYRETQEDEGLLCCIDEDVQTWCYTADLQDQHQKTWCSDCLGAMRAIPSKLRLDFVDLYKLQLLCKMYQSKALLVDADLQDLSQGVTEVWTWWTWHSMTDIKTKSATPNSCSNVLLRWNNRHHQAAAYWRFDAICAFVAWCSRDWGPSNSARWSARGKHAMFKERLPPPLATPACTACYWDLLGELQGRK